MSLLLWAGNVLKRKGPAPPPPPVPSYAFSRALDRTFSGHPVWGGGNVNNSGSGNRRRADFEHDGQMFEIWQVIPFDGPAIGGVLGACTIQIRNRSKNRGQNTLEEMPTRITLSAEGGDTADWTGLPWSFTRGTGGAARFGNVSSGNSARVRVQYLADRPSVGASPAAVGIAQGESFTFTAFFDP